MESALPPMPASQAAEGVRVQIFLQKAISFTPAGQEGGASAGQDWEAGEGEAGGDAGVATPAREGAGGGDGNVRDREGYRSRNRKVGFKNSRGVTLAGSLHLPKEAPTGSVVLAHSFTSSRNLKIVARLAACLAEGRWAVLRFDFTGLGDSEGRFEESCLSENIDDVGAAVEWVTERFPGECLLGGHSLGGATAVLAAVGLEAVTAVASLAAPSDSDHLMRLFSRKALQTIRREGSASIPVAGRSVRIGRRFVEDLSRHRVAEAAAQLARPLLVLHGTEDRVVDIREGEKLFAAAHQPKAFVPLVGADHLMTDRRYARRVATVLSLWWCDFEPPGEVP